MAAVTVVAVRTKAPPWAAAVAAIAVGAGVPGLVYGSQVYPEATAALLVAVALLLVTDDEHHPFLCALALFALAWLGVKYVPLGAVLAVGYARRHPVDWRAVAALAVAGLHFAWWHQHTFGGLTPYATNIVWSGEGDSAILADHVDWGGRTYRLYGLFLDARFGLFRWLPAAPLALWGITRRTAAYAAPLVVCVLMGTFVSITIMGWWFPGRMLIAGLPGLAVLVAHGAARLPRVAAVLTAWSLAIAASVAIAAHTERIRLAVDPFTLGLPLPPAALFPDFRAFGARQITLTILWGAALTMLRWRSSSSSTATPSPTAPSSPSRPTWRPPRAR